MTQVEVFYTRYEDGSQPVKRIKKKPEEEFLYELGQLGPNGKNQWIQFESARSLLIHVTGHPNARNWTFDRYFKAKKPEQPSLILDLFGHPKEIVKPKATIGILAPDMSVWPRIIKTTRRAPSTPVTHLGIDLAKRAVEVAKLFYAGFGAKVVKMGYNPEDLLQEVYRGILARNQGKCPFDPSKSSFGHYVHMVCGCIVSNYGRKQRRINAHEQLGARSYTKDDDGYGYTVDARDFASTRVEAPKTATRQQAELQEAALDFQRFLYIHEPGLAPLLMQIATLLQEGRSKDDIPQALHITKSDSALMYRRLKELSKLWIKKGHDRRAL